MRSDALNAFVPPKAPSFDGVIGAVLGLLTDVIIGREARAQTASVVQAMERGRQRTIEATESLRPFDVLLAELAEGPLVLESLPHLERIERNYEEMLERARGNRKWAVDRLEKDDRSIALPFLDDLRDVTKRTRDALDAYIAVLERQLEELEDLCDELRAERNLAAGDTVPLDEVRTRLGLP